MKNKNMKFNLVYFIIIFFLFGCSEKNTPILGIKYGNKMYIPVFDNVPSNPPEVISSYYIPFNDENKAMIVVECNLEKYHDNVEIEKSVFSKHGGFLTTRALIYDIIESSGKSPDGKYLIFTKQEKLKLILDDNIPVYISLTSNEMWKIIMLGSTEGIHYYLQSITDDICTTTLDYYQYLGYDIEGDPLEMHEKAKCGEVISGGYSDFYK